MLTITIFAAGLVCLAGVLGIRLGQAQAQVATATAGTTRAVAEPTTDERGITLQTLIVTAVLVLMAVAAGVVIVAITNNAAEDLEQQASSIDSICTEVEIYDPTLAALGRKGSNGGQDGSRDGCIPVCVVKQTGTSFASTDVDSSADLKFERTTDETISIATSSTATHFLFKDKNTLFTSIDISATLSGNSVRVSPSQNDCILVDATGDKIP